MCNLYAFRTKLHSNQKSNIPESDRIVTEPKISQTVSLTLQPLSHNANLTGSSSPWRWILRSIDPSNWPIFVTLKFNVPSSEHRSRFDCLANSEVASRSSDLFGVTRVPRALGSTRTQLRDHVINEKPSNHVYRVYRSTAALHPNYLANIYRDKGRRIDTNEITRPPRLLYACAYVRTYIHACARVCDDTVPRRSIVTRLIVARATYVCLEWKRFDILRSLATFNAV